MTTAFDFGTHCFRSLIQEEDRLVAGKMRPVYQSVPDNATWRNVLSQLDIESSSGPDCLVVTGNDVDRLSDLVSSPLGCLLPDGGLPDNDPACRQLIAGMVEALLPPARNNDICALTQPIGVSMSNNPNQSFLAQLVRLRGYNVSSVNAGLSVVLAEGENSGFTGIGMCIGETAASVSLVRQGIELAHCMVPTGGGWIDEQIALAETKRVWDPEGNCYLNTSEIEQWKLEQTSPVCEPECSRGRLMKTFYEEMIGRIVSKVAAEFSASVSEAMLSQTYNLYCAGGAAQVNGFERLLNRNILTSHQLEIPLGEICVVADDGFCVARGGLIHAEIEAEVQERRVAA